MSIHAKRNRFGNVAALVAAVVLAGAARAEVVTDANASAAAIASTIPATPVAVRTMAIVQVSVFDAVRSITGRGTAIVAGFASPKDASTDAAVAAATRTALLALVPGQRPAIEEAYAAALAAVPAGSARTAGVAAGERAANAVLAARASDGASAPDRYRPRTAPGVYVPTARPLLPHWGGRRPWVLSSGSALRPEAPPALDSDTWRRDLDEVATMGAKGSTHRTPEQTRAARFWDTTAPSVYWPVVRDVALARGGDADTRARLLAEAGMAMDDAMIAVFDAKYAYEFWRPVTAIRNAPGAARDSAWEPLIETPMHPEYPCAHCIVSAAVGTVLETWIGEGPSPVLHSTSPTGDGVEHTWSTPAEFVREVSEARICAGVHYRHSAEVAQAMGRRVGELIERRQHGTGGKPMD